MRERSVAVNDSPPSPPPFCFAGIGEVSFVCISGRLINDMELYEEPLVFASLLAVSQFVLVPLPPSVFLNLLPNLTRLPLPLPLLLVFLFPKIPYSFGSTLLALRFPFRFWWEISPRPFNEPSLLLFSIPR